ncbi:aldo/keto reductase [Microlunatus speluncae]|uniref:aldo/keto reductase n=1 Tax=Microlunatus speluncae TaxID=2594267 RepID=UPI0012665531|nr:aldo/keto reductase [Microlunatus speluncae]
MSSERLIIGAAQLGQPYGRGARRPPEPDEVGRWLAAAATADVAGIDTARAYGDSEAMIGAARAGAESGPAAATGERPTEAAGPVPIVTKIRPLTEFDAGAAPQEVERAVRASLLASLTALRTATIDTLLLHRAGDLRAGSGRPITVLDDLRRDGLIGRWGVSLGSPAELIDALDVPGLGYVQLPYNLLDRRWCAPEVEAALAARPEVMVAARSAYLQGILVDPLARHWPGPRPADAAELAERLSGLGRELGRQSLRDLALGYVLGQAWVDAVVVGARSAEQIADAARLVGNPPLTATEIARARAELPAGPLDLVDPARWPPAPDRPFEKG